MSKRARELIMLNLAMMTLGMFTYYLGTQSVVEASTLVIEVTECQPPADAVETLTPI